MSGADPRRALRRRRCNAATGVTLLHYRVDPPVTNVSVGEYGSIIVLNLVVDVVQVWLNPKLKFE